MSSPDFSSREQPTASIRSIAAAAGCSKSVVARVLANQRGVAEETRERVRRVALAQGYAADPEVARLMLHLRQRRKRRATGSLAWVRYARSPAVPQRFPWFAPIWQGAVEQAAELGYGVEQVIEDCERLTPERFAKILRARGVTGLIASPPWQAEVFARLSVDDMAVAIVGEGNRPYVYDQAGPDYFFNIHLLMSEVLALGYRRPGLVVSDYMDVISVGRIVAAYQWVQRSLPPEDRLPWESRISNQGAELAPWLRRWRPDVLICANNTWKEVLARLGLRVPRDIGLAHINLATDVADWGGIDPQHARIGANAVNLLAEQLQQGRRGRPEHPRQVLTAGRFVRGATLRKLD